MYILFDLDGTLLDTSPGIKESLKYTVDKLGLKPIPESQINTFIGPPIQHSLARHYSLSKDRADQAAAIFRTHYSHETLLQATPYPGIIETLQILKQHNIPLAVATYKREDYALRLLEHFGFHKLCDVMHGADAQGRLTKADIILQCINELHATPNQTYLVGDTSHDAIAAAQANIGFIAVTWGFQFKTAGDVADYPCHKVINHPADLLSLI